MQSNKASKKTSTSAEESIPSTDNIISADAKPKPRAAKSSKPKSESADTAAAKRHRKAQSPVPAEETQTAWSEESAVELSTVPSSEPKVDDFVSAEPSVAASEEDVRILAYQFWLDRGMPHGSEHEDWTRAERVLAARA